MTRTGDLARRFEREKKLLAEEIPDVVAFALVLGARAEQRADTKRDNYHRDARGGRNARATVKDRNDGLVRRFKEWRKDARPLSLRAAARAFLAETDPDWLHGPNSERDGKVASLLNLRKKRLPNKPGA